MQRIDLEIVLFAYLLATAWYTRISRSHINTQSLPREPTIPKALLIPKHDDD